MRLRRGFPVALVGGAALVCAFQGRAKVFADAYTHPYGIHFRHDNTSQGWDLYATEGRKIVEGKASLAQGLAELNRRMNDLVKFGSCQPYQGLKHPLQL